MEEKIKQILLLLICLTAHAPQAWPQEVLPFSEGRLTYNVRMAVEQDRSGSGEISGRYVIYIKGKMLRKELLMHNGYESIMIWNGQTETGYSLQQIAGKAYAVQLSRKDLETAQAPYLGLVREDIQGNEYVAGDSCRNARVTYRSGKTSALCYSPNWSISQPMIYEWYPGTDRIPVTFHIHTESGITLDFSSEGITSMPVENSRFQVPPGHKIISNPEYKRLTRQ